MSDLNDRIAKAKGWTWHINPVCCMQSNRVWIPDTYTHWTDPSGIFKQRPDFTGTLEGVAGMMRELGPEWNWAWNGIGYDCSRGLNCGPDEYFWSPDDRPGDCVGAAWLSVFDKSERSC